MIQRPEKSLSVSAQADRNRPLLADGGNAGQAFLLGMVPCSVGASLIAQSLKNLPAMQKIRVQSLSREEPLEEEMATHSSILAWEMPRTEMLGGLQSMGSQKSWTQLTD